MAHVQVLKQHSRGIFKRGSTGNSLMEYALPLCVFFLTGVILATIGNVPQRLTSMYEDSVKMDRRQGSSVVVSGMGSYDPPGAQGLAAPQQGQQSLCTGSGLCLNVSTFTGGGLGGNNTTQMANTLNTLAQSLQDAGASPALVAQVQQAAADAASVSSVMRDLESACSSGTCTFTAAQADAKALYENIKNCGGSTGGDSMLGGCSSGGKSYPGFTQLNNLLESQQSIQNYYNNNPMLARNTMLNDAQSLINNQVSRINTTVRSLEVNGNSVSNTATSASQTAASLCTSGGCMTRTSATAPWQST